MEIRLGYRIKKLRDDIRLWYFHWLNGPGFEFHGLNVEVPGNIQFAIKKQLIRGVQA